ncbi:LOW QUALITY PROTEIN: cysteine/serine-rich nuclear protein 1b [Rhinoraja longicauda]
MSGLLKRKFVEVDGEACSSPSPSSSPPSSSPSPSCSPSSSCSSSSSASSSACCSLSSWDSDDDESSGEAWSARCSAPFPSAPFTPVPILKRARRARECRVQFDRVVVFYFARCQGFTSVPSQGGCTLGMAHMHSSCRQYTLAEFAREQEMVHAQKIRELLREQKLNARRLQLSKGEPAEVERAERLTLDQVSDEEVEVDVDSGFFPQPYPARQRLAMLRAAGVKRIDRDEKRELSAIRLSREQCGCDCRGYCEPETCRCSQAGIKCQMDRMSFPCGCTKDGCGNTMGRIEFNSARVQTHFIHTIMKLDLESRQSGGVGGELEPALLDNPSHRGGYPERPASVAAAFHYGKDSEDNSCSSDMTDSSITTTSSSSSSSSSSSCYSDGGPGFLDNLPPHHHRQTAATAIDDDGLARILHFNDSDNDGTPDPRPRDPFPYFSPSDFLCERPCAEREPGLDENANQEHGFSLGHMTPMQSSDPSPYSSPPHGPEQSTRSYTDLSLSMDSFEFFQSFSESSYAAFHAPLKDYEGLDNCPSLQFPFPAFPQTLEPANCFLESLIGLAEPIMADSFPEPPTPFPDNQHLEEAIKTSIMETVKV